MALNSFAAGALVAAPVAGVLTWLAVTWQQHVDLRVERDTAVVRADRAAFDQRFNADWAAMTGQDTGPCDASANAELVALRQRVAEMETKLAGSSDTLERDAAELRRLVEEENR
jgi:hypothetical protein